MIKKFLKAKRQEGFTLVELLVVMAILALLIAISIAGLGFAMRRARNIQRTTAVANVERALQAYYADHEKYPVAGGTTSDDDVATLPLLIDDRLKGQFEGSWNGGPPGTRYWYATDANGLYFIVCVNQEAGLGGNDWIYCSGPGMGAGAAAGMPADVDHNVGDTTADPPAETDLATAISATSMHVVSALWYGETEWAATATDE